MSEKKTEKVVAIRKGGANEEVAARLNPVHKKEYSSLVKAVRKTCTWVVIFTSILFAFVAILSIWIDAEDIMGRTWGTFIIVCIVSGLIALIAPLLDQNN